MKGIWFGASKRDPRVVDLYSRHYSAGKNGASRADWLGHGIVAPGECMVLLTADCRALFVWLRQRFRVDGQEGVNCAVFRNEGAFGGRVLSSEMIVAAERLAWERWPGERLFTFVDGEATEDRRGNGKPAGYCFLMAGWRRCGWSDRRELVILEKLAPGRAARAKVRASARSAGRGVGCLGAEVGCEASAGQIARRKSTAQAAGRGLNSGDTVLETGAWP